MDVWVLTNLPVSNCKNKTHTTQHCTAITLLRSSTSRRMAFNVISLFVNVISALKAIRGNHRMSKDMQQKKCNVNSLVWTTVFFQSHTIPAEAQHFSLCWSQIHFRSKLHRKHKTLTTTPYIKHTKSRSAINNSNNDVHTSHFSPTLRITTASATNIPMINRGSWLCICLISVSSSPDSEEKSSKSKWTFSSMLCACCSQHGGNGWWHVYFSARVHEY